MSTRDEMNRYLTALELTFNLTDMPLEVPQKFEALNSLMIKDPSLREKVSNYAQAQAKLLTSQTIKGDPFSLDMKSDVIYYLTMTLISRLGSSKSAHSPKVHHWLPLCFIKKFRGSKVPNSRNYTVKSLRFTDSGVFQEEVIDTFFAHGIDEEGNGFYNLSVESFFSVIEALYLESTQKLTNPNQYKGARYVDLVRLYGFFLSQAVRNPRPELNVKSIRTINGFVNSLITMIDYVETPRGHFIQTDYDLFFTPYVPQREIKMSDSNHALVFPTSSRAAFIVSDVPLISEKAQNAVKTSQNSTLLEAKKNKLSIYGVTHSSFKGAL